MNRPDISKRISSILGDIQRLNNTLYAMNTTDIQRYPDNYEILSSDAIRRAESIACRMRHLLYASTNIRKSEYLLSAATVLDIKIQQRDGIFEITLPCLLPKRKQSWGTEFLIDPLTAALEQYVKTHVVKRFRHCVICFTYVYSQDLPKRRVQDNDNLEEKQCLDAIAAYLMYDDGGLYCDIYRTAELGAADSTHIFIMDKPRFPAWLAERGIQLLESGTEQTENE